MKNISALFTAIFLCTFCYSQKLPKVEVLREGINASFRGLSAPSDDIVWVSGSNGTVGKSTDGGNTWKWIKVAGYEQKDFRDIEAFDSLTAIIMAVDNPGIILKTTDGGVTWKKVFEKHREGMFLDAMDFRNSKEGICIGDPFYVSNAGRKFFYIIKTNDGGDTWTEVPLYQLPPTQEDKEAIFAASGTTIKFLDHPDFEFAFVSGGSISNIYFIGRAGKQSKVINIPINQGIESSGAFSLTTDGNKKFYVAGGEYKAYWVAYDNFYFSSDAGNKWKSASVAGPNGYRSCVVMIDDKTFIACGTNGVDVSFNECKEWKSVVSDGVKGTNGFNVAAKSKTGRTVYFAGDKRVAKLIW
jgi:photosystem II stability/assembly factor-like uncharacterized protein